MSIISYFLKCVFKRKSRVLASKKAENWRKECPIGILYALAGLKSYFPQSFAKKR
jgi:hypothetical protein